MSDKLVDRRNLDFVLNEMLNVEELTQHEYYEDHSIDTFNMALDTAYQLAREKFWPTYQEFDRNPASFDGTKTTVPAAMHDLWKAAAEGGWFSAAVEAEHGGQQFPSSVQLSTSLMFNAANTAAQMYIVGSTGAGELIASFGTDEQRELYMHKLFAGEWGGTMALTEPQAGSSLADVKTTAVKADDGDYYYITGTKRFISSGDQDITENIIHPTLAKIEGAPDGAKGISLFIVPKIWVNEDGSLGEPNDVLTASLEHKLGIRGQATAELKYGENGKCKGVLLGEAHRGLSYMFQLMNSARVHTGIQAVSQASAAYFCALQYANEREQGREATNKNPASPQIPIIKHAAVRRMLVNQKAYVEGCISLLLYTAHLQDKLRLAETDEEKKNLLGVVELMTPLCKAYVSDVSYDSINMAVQCLGGCGYIEEFPVAQMLRDNRVFPIYEGTNEIQAMDLLGRKVIADNGSYFRLLLAEIGKTLEEAKAYESLNDMSGKVEAAMNEIAGLTMHLGQIAMSGDIDLYLSYAGLYLRAFSQMTVAWLFLWQCISAEKALAGNGQAGIAENFYLSKLATAKHYINTVLPSTHTLAEEIMAGERTAYDFKEEWFPATV